MMSFGVSFGDNKYIPCPQLYNKRSGRALTRPSSTHNSQAKRNDVRKIVFYVRVIKRLHVVGGWNVPVSKNEKETKQMAKRKTDDKYVDVLTTVRIERETDRLIELTVKELDISQSTFIRQASAEESVIPLEIVGAEDNPKTGHRFYDRVKDSVEYVIENLGTLVFVWDKFRGM